MTDFQIETTRTTNVEARKGYRNIWQIIAKNLICDPTEKTLLLYMADPTPTPTPTPTSAMVDPNTRVVYQGDTKSSK